jgi:hypothetical protein
VRTLVCLAALLAWGSAAAAPDRLAVVALDAPADLTFTGRNLSDAIAAEARTAGGFEVLGAAEVEKTLGRPGAAELTRCADDGHCLAARAKALGVDRVVGGWVQQAGDRYVVAVVHVDARSGAALASFRREVPIASRRLRDDVVAASAGLLRGQADAAGWLKIDTSVQGAAVTIDGRPAGTTPLARRVEAGRHRVQVSMAGHAAADPVWVDVPAGQTVEHHQRLFEIPARDRGNAGAAAATRVDVVR